uniref:BAI1 associated protein 3 n=1 Tax=Sparus aurata TaxID=8175 RepID=A0A671UFV8_SPAAU
SCSTFFTAGEFLLESLRHEKHINSFTRGINFFFASPRVLPGYSDPYCMLGILVGQSPREVEDKKERKFSFRKRKEKLEKRSSTKEVLPARCIQVTEVKPETLNPVWDEHFVFEVDDVHNDLLHLDIWDHDDDVSVAEACKKLNEVSGLRGMGRYFKQIAKSVRANGSASSGSEENVDDFLGCLNIPLNEIPVGGYDTWFKLEPRSSTSKVQGECHLIMKLFTNQILPCLPLEPYNWNGQVCPAAWTILTHHAVQTDLPPLQQAIIRWQCYSSHHRTQRVCYSLLLRLLRTIDAEWDPTAGPSCVQERQLSDSFRLYTEHCLCLMKNMRQVFPCTSAAAITRYELMLSHYMDQKKTCHRFYSMCLTCCMCGGFFCGQLDPVQQAKHSSSAVEVTACFSQVREIWLQLAWPDSAGAFIFITRLTDVSPTRKKYISTQGDIFTVQLCVALNNTEHVRVFLGHLPCDLDWQGVERAMEESCGVEGKEQVYKALNGQLFNMDLDLQREAKRLIAQLTDKMLPELRRYIQHISLSPDSINNDDAVSPLMKYLQDTMVILTEHLVKETLTRVLQSMWELLLRMILDAVAENRGVQVEFYNRFQYTVETLLHFFHMKGEGLSVEDMKSGDYKVLDEELRLNKCSSFELIEQYYLEKISHQKTLKHTRFGRISVKCYYDAPEQRLTVEILHAADIIALDANGLSDPFVIVELCPHHLFPMAKSQRTQVKLKTLHPVFDELFYFHVSPEQYRHRFACLTFTVMDYDWLSTNDFAGEAVAPLSDFCWPGRPNATPAGKSVQPSILHLSRSKPSGLVFYGRSNRSAAAFAPLRHTPPLGFIRLFRLDCSLQSARWVVEEAKNLGVGRPILFDSVHSHSLTPVSHCTFL